MVRVFFACLGTLSIILGIVLCVTIIGLPIGVPVIVGGFLFLAIVAILGELEHANELSRFYGNATLAELRRIASASTPQPESALPLPQPTPSTAILSAAAPSRSPQQYEAEIVEIAHKVRVAWARKNKGKLEGMKLVSAVSKYLTPELREWLARLSPQRQVEMVSQ